MMLCIALASPRGDVPIPVPERVAPTESVVPTQSVVVPGVPERAFRIFMFLLFDSSVALPSLQHALVQV